MKRSSSFKEGLEANIALTRDRGSKKDKVIPDMRDVMNMEFNEKGPLQRLGKIFECLARCATAQVQTFIEIIPALPSDAEQSMASRMNMNNAKCVLYVGIGHKTPLSDLTDYCYTVVQQFIRTSECNLAMFGLTLLSLGKLKSCINRNCPGTFLGTTPRGEGCVKGPVVRSAAISWGSLVVSNLRLFMAEGWLT